MIPQLGESNNVYFSEIDTAIWFSGRTDFHLYLLNAQTVHKYLEMEPEAFYIYDAIQFIWFPTSFELQIIV